MSPLRLRMSISHSSLVTPGAVDSNNNNMSVKNEYVSTDRVSCVSAFCHFVFFIFFLIPFFSHFISSLGLESFFLKDNRVTLDWLKFIMNWCYIRTYIGFFIWSDFIITKKHPISSHWYSLQIRKCKQYFCPTWVSNSKPLALCTLHKIYLNLFVL